jgi:UDP-N-acetylglucosamine diphosphorylase/glucosamine-1-phosphate N-acetyltransferase
VAARAGPGDFEDVWWRGDEPPSAGSVRDDMISAAIILAAGKGTRMRSDLPKVAHQLNDRALVTYPIAAALAAGVRDVVVVVGHGADLVQRIVAESFPTARFATQPEQRGTGHAVMCAMPEVADDVDVVLVLSGDVPGVRAETLAGLVDGARRSSSGLAMCTFEAADPTGYGRILRDDGAAGVVVGIREERDASTQEKAIRECNAGVYAFATALLRDALPRLTPHNAAGELYLTDVVADATHRGAVVTVLVPELEVSGVNTPEQLEALARTMASAPIR